MGERAVTPDSRLLRLSLSAMLGLSSCCPERGGGVSVEGGGWLSPVAFEGIGQLVDQRDGIDCGVPLNRLVCR